MFTLRCSFTQSRACRLRAAVAASALAAVWLTANSAVANAQANMELRAAISETDAGNDLLLRRRATNATGATSNTAPRTSSTPDYQPTSAGAVADDPAASLFDDPTAADNPFGEAPIPSAQPDTAAQRRGAAPETAAERNRPVTLEEDVATGAVRQGTVGETESDFGVIDPAAERVGAIERKSIQSQDNPYAPIGLQAGSFTLRPSFEQGITATNNANLSQIKQSSVLSETTLRLNGGSDWALNSLTFDAYATYKKSVSGAEIEQPEGGLSAQWSYELAREYQLKGGFNYTIRPESASSPVDLGPISSEPVNQSLDANLGVTKELGKTQLGLTGRIERDWYGDADLTMGGTLSQKDRNNTLATLALRAGYEISPAITPFVELEAGRRFYDLDVDAAGYARSGNKVAARAGVSVDTGDKLTGEFAVGWLRESFDDDRLDAISGADISAGLRWSPERGTMIGLNATTTVEGTTTAGDSGSLLHSLRLTGEREIRTNLTANAQLGFDYRSYPGSGGNDTTYLAEIGATWWLNRYLGLTSRAKYERQESTLPGRGYDAASVFVGIKAQR